MSVSDEESGEDLVNKLLNQISGDLTFPHLNIYMQSDGADPITWNNLDIKIKDLKQSLEI